MEINEIIKTGKAEAVNNALIEATLGDNLLVIKKLFKKRGDDIDINAYSSAGQGSQEVLVQYLLQQDSHQHLVLIFN